LGILHKVRTRNWIVAEGKQSQKFQCHQVLLSGSSWLDSVILLLCSFLSSSELTITIRPAKSIFLSKVTLLGTRGQDFLWDTHWSTIYFHEDMGSTPNSKGGNLWFLGRCSPWFNQMHGRIRSYFTNIVTPATHVGSD
jgi:hypothetical protein